MPNFAAWLLQQFTGGRPTDEMTFSELERICASAASLLIGAAYAQPGSIAFAPSSDRSDEAQLIARRTADGFRASLDDRQNTVIAWPWDHIATSVAWTATRSGDTSESALGERILAVALPYATRHREQLSAVLGLWQEIAGNLHPEAPRPNLARMGEEMLAAYRTIYPAAASSPAG